MEEKEIHRYKALIGLITYLLTFFIIGTFITYGICKAIASDSIYSYKEILTASSKYSDNSDLMKYASKLNAYSNITIYFISAVSLGVVLFIFLKEDFNKLKTWNIKKVLLVFGIALLFVAFSYFSSVLITKIVGDNSVNEKILHDVIKRKQFRFIMFISVVLLAPFVEEMVFRKCIFKLMNHRPFWVALITSSLVFALMHMFSTHLSWKWIVLFVGYILDALCLALIYKYFDENIYASMLAHMLNNMIMFIIVIA